MKTSKFNDRISLFLPEFVIFVIICEEQHGYSKTHDEFKKEKTQAGIKMCDSADRVGGISVAMQPEIFKRCDYESFSKYFKHQILTFSKKLLCCNNLVLIV